MTCRIDKDDAIVAFIAQHWEEKDYGPTIREIQRACNFSTTSLLSIHLWRLAAQGRIRREKHVQRSIRLPRI